jgi:hypothetical protein
MSLPLRKTCWITVSLSAALLASCRSPPVEPANADIERYLAVHRRASPEEVLRRFFRGIIDGDLVVVTETTLPHPEIADAIGVRDPAEVAPQWLTKAFLETPIRRITVGETIQIPTPQGPFPLKIDANQVNDGRVMLMLGDHPIPWIVVRVEGQWRVDPSPWIAAMQKGREISGRPKVGST